MREIYGMKMKIINKWEKNYQNGIVTPLDSCGL